MERYALVAHLFLDTIQCAGSYIYIPKRLGAGILDGQFAFPSKNLPQSVLAVLLPLRDKEGGKQRQGFLVLRLYIGHVLKALGQNQLHVCIISF